MTAVRLPSIYQTLVATIEQLSPSIIPHTVSRVLLHNTSFQYDSALHSTTPELLAYRWWTDVQHDPPCYLLHMTNVLYEWAMSTDVPHTLLPTQRRLAYTTLDADRAHFVESFVLNMHADRQEWMKSVAGLSEFFRVLQRDAVLLLLGFPFTVGSSPASCPLWLPPSPAQCLAAAEEIHNRELTVGGRALSKHAHRGSDSWWGIVKGPQRVVSESAKHALQRIFDQCTWINLHVLPHNVLCYEMRHADMYGARWTCHPESSLTSVTVVEEEGKDCCLVDHISQPPPEHPDPSGVQQDDDATVQFVPAKVVFRGFLEPPMEAGHLVGWRH